MLQSDIFFTSNEGTQYKSMNADRFEEFCLGNENISYKTTPLQVELPDPLASSLGSLLYAADNSRDIICDENGLITCDIDIEKLASRHSLNDLGGINLIGTTKVERERQSITYNDFETLLFADRLISLIVYPSWRANLFIKYSNIIYDTRVLPEWREMQSELLKKLIEDRNEYHWEDDQKKYRSANLYLNSRLSYQNGIRIYSSSDMRNFKLII